MWLGIGLVLLQAYPFVLAATRGSSGGVGVVLLILAGLVIVAQVYAIARLRGTSREWVSYPVAFGGLLMSGCLLVPLMLSIF